MRQPSRFSAISYFRAIFFVALSGILTSAYLAVSHYRNYIDIEYQSFCAISRSLNCDTVSQSPYSIFWNVPWAVWGIVGYSFFALLLLFFKPRKNGFPGLSVLGILAAGFVMVGISLALVSSFWVKSYCLMCMVCYAVNFMLLLLTWMAQKRYGSGNWVANLNADIAHIRHNSIGFCSIWISFLVLSLAIVFVYPKYWRFPVIPENAEIEYGVTGDGNPWIGAQNPQLTIIEFTDYMCFQCGKMHTYLRRLISKYPDKIRLVHRHFPLDRHSNPLIKEAVHEKSGLLSLLAIYAQDQDKFWTVNDILFREARQTKRFNFNAIAKEAGLDLSNFRTALSENELTAHLFADIQAAASHGINATPSYLINGKIYPGTIPIEIFDSLQ